MNRRSVSPRHSPLTPVEESARHPKSYSSLPGGLASRIRELCELYRIHRGNAAERARAVDLEMLRAEQRILDAGGVRLGGIEVLDVGSGQQTGYTFWLATRGKVTAIDLSPSPEGFDLRAYASLLRENGLVRLVKTLGRKTLGVDRRFRAELGIRLGVSRLPPVRNLRMDACRMGFSDESFDLVFSRSVWEHIADPGAALREVARVLRRGGTAHITVHSYTSDSGCHDPRILSGRRAGLPAWAHLRPEWSQHVRPNSFLNRLRLVHWRELFEECMPGVQLETSMESGSWAREALSAARARGELAEYSDEELLTVAVHAVWNKAA